MKAVKPFTFVELTEAELLPEKINESVIMDKILSDIDNSKRWYHARVFMYCKQYGNVLAFSKISKIPYEELRRVYLEYKTYLKHWIKGQ